MNKFPILIPRCDALLVGDIIVAVNGIRVAGLNHEEMIKVLKNTGLEVRLEIEYVISETGRLTYVVQIVVFIKKNVYKVIFFKSACTSIIYLFVMYKDKLP